MSYIVSEKVTLREMSGKCNPLLGLPCTIKCHHFSFSYFCPYLQPNNFLGIYPIRRNTIPKIMHIFVFVLDVKIELH